MSAYAYLFYICIFVLGAVMGSFVGAMTWRMRHHRDWVRGRSECEHCHHQLAAVDLIPIISYLSLRGKCRYCRKPIGKTALILEVGSGLAFLASALLLPSALAQTWLSPVESFISLDAMTSLTLGLWFVCLTLMIALFNYDLHWRLLPNKLVFPLIGVSFILSAVIGFGIEHLSVGRWLLNLAMGMVPIAGVYGLMYLISNGRWIGLGDVKLGLAIGCLVPWWGGIIVLFLSNLLGSLVAVPKLIDHKVKGSTQIPFGPYLITSTYLVFLLGWVIKSLVL